ncbi:MAG: ArsR/SmtB family transcription factor [Candidatus Dormibacteria bacterium]
MVTGQLSVHFLGWSNQTRLRLVEVLAGRGELTVHELALHLHASQPRISWHLRILRRAQIVKTRRAGRECFCSLDLDAIRGHQEQLWNLLGASAQLHKETA